MINLYVNDILKALENKCYFSALSLALALPDFCGSVEFPDKSVTERYINWYDNYVKNFMSYKSFGASQLSGEVVYNLRNTYLHLGSPNIITSKIKQESNRIDKFTLLLGDATKIQVIFFCVDTPFGSSRAITIDVSFFCKSLCDCASHYYEFNKDKFQFDFNVIRQEDLEIEKYCANEIVFKEYPLTQTINKQLIEKSIIYEESIIDNTIDSTAADGLKQEQKTNKADDVNKTDDSNKIDNVIKADDANKINDVNKTDETDKIQKISDFISENFPEKKFKDKKQVIIDAILNSNSRTAINNELMKTFPDHSDVKLIMERIKPITQDMSDKTKKIVDFVRANFIEEKFTDKQQVIIRTILNSDSRTEINNTLTKTFPGDMKTIMSRLKPLIKDMPGQ